MSNYTKTTDFEAKDSLPSGDSGKIIRGSEFETEFDAISTAIATKADAASPTFTGTVTIDGLTVNGNTTLGNAATDTVTVTADIASNLIPSADDTHDLGASGAEWKDLYVDGVAYIDTVAGFATTENITFGDGDRAIFGASSDLQIYHSGTASHITENGSGSLFIDGTNLRLRSSTEEIYLEALADGAVTLYHDNASKFATTSTGVDVTGVITTDGMTTSADINFGDNDKAVFGAGSDLQIYHDGNNSYIDDSGTGLLRLRSNQIYLEKYTGEIMAALTADAGVNLRYDNAIKLETTSTGIDVTGTVTADEVDLSVKAVLGGTTPRIEFFENDTTDLNARIRNTGGTFQIQSTDDAGTTSKSRIVVDHATGDISFREDTGTTAKLFWDASAESLGIGTSSPTATVHSISSDATPSFLADGGTGDFAVPDGQAMQFVHWDGSSTATERMRINTSGNVGIGTDSPSVRLDISGSLMTSGVAYFHEGTSSSANAIEIGRNRSVDGSVFIDFTTAAAGADNDFRIIREGGLNGNAQFDNRGTGSLLFKTQNTERVRIDSSGNLLVGKTGAGVGTNGVQLLPNSDSAITRDAGPALYLNRNTSEGDVLILRKDNATVGSIGTVGGEIYIESGDVGLQFDASGNDIVPYGGGYQDAAIDLGASGVRFKDLYLSGGAYLGGTAAANKLDDYEEGTFTPAVVGATTAGTGTYTTQTGKYTKVGNLVFIQIYLDYNSHTGVGNLEIIGLPFTPVTQAGMTFGSVSGLTKSANYALGADTAFNSAKIRIYEYDVSSTTTSRSNLAMDAAAIINLTGVIRVD